LLSEEDEHRVWSGGPERLHEPGDHKPIRFLILQVEKPAQRIVPIVPTAPGRVDKANIPAACGTAPEAPIHASAARGYLDGLPTSVLQVHLEDTLMLGYTHVDFPLRAVEVGASL
jgi:hypothetical protein